MSQCDTANLPDILQCFNITEMGVMEGQQYDMNYENNPAITEDDYLKMIELKTAILVAAGGRIGAIGAGAATADCDRMYKFGLKIGMAFQIQDDVLDTYGESKVFGKNIGKDIANNKKTYLLVLAIRLAKGEQKQKLNDLLKSQDIPAEEKYNAVKAIYDDLKIKDLALDKIKALYNEALAELEGVNVKPERKEHLLTYVNKIIERRS